MKSRKLSASCGAYWQRDLTARRRRADRGAVAHNRAFGRYTASRASRNRAIFDRGSSFYIDGTELTFHIPFSGERDLFKFQPSTHTMNPPRGIVGENELRLLASATADRRDSLKPALDAEVAKVKLYADYTDADVSKFNACLDGTARAAATRRREKASPTATWSPRSGSRSVGARTPPQPTPSRRCAGRPRERRPAPPPRPPSRSCRPRNTRTS